MYHIVHDSSTPGEEFLKSIFKIFTSTNLGLIKGLSSNHANCSTFPRNVHEHDSSKP